MDVIEANQAFAAQAIAVNKALALDPAKTKPNGGAIALDHLDRAGRRIPRAQGRRQPDVKTIWQGLQEVRVAVLRR